MTDSAVTNSAEPIDPARIPRPRALPALLGSAVLCIAAAGIGGAVTGPNIASWYHGLAKPSFNPPDWVFGPAWTILFTMMALVLWQIWRTPTPTREAFNDRRRALIVFVVHLVFNVMWSVVFFGLRSPTVAIAVVIALWIGVLATMLTARRVIGWPAYAFLPYLAWVSFAAVLNVAIAMMNPA